MSGQPAPVCPYCRTPLGEESDVHACPTCGTRHHEECWAENGGCTVVGCESAPEPHGDSAQTALPPIPEESDQPVAVDADAPRPRRRRLVVLVGVLVILAMAAVGVAVALVVRDANKGEVVESEPETTEANVTEAKPAEPERLSADSPLGTEGLGPVEVGMTIDEAEDAAQVPLKAEGQAATPGCQYYTSPKLDGVSFMVHDGEVARVDVFESDVATEDGIRVGDSPDDVRDVYGEEIITAPAELNPDYKTLTYTPQDGKTKMIFSTDRVTITYIQAGRVPEVEYAEGCL